MLLHLEIPIGGSVKKVGPNVFVCPSVCLSVCLCVQALWHVAPKRVDRSGRGGTVRCTDLAERRWCRSRVGRHHVPRATWRRANLCTKFVVRAAGQTAGDPGVPSAGHVTPAVNHDPLWFPSPRGARRTCEGRKTFLARGPPVQGNVELATPNFAH